MIIKIIKYYTSILILLLITSLNAQGGASSCSQLQSNYSAYQFCATNIAFNNSVGGNSEVFDTTCISELFQGPTWFFMQIQNSGNINLLISQVNTAGNDSDVDFVLWGPFANLTNICAQLDESTEVDCSWLPDSSEIVTLSGAVQGEYYILMVDNYSNEPGQITISQISGSGSSDCSFLSPVQIKDSDNNEISQTNFCKPDTKDIKAIIDISGYSGLPENLRFNYKWFLNGVLLNTITDSVDNTNLLAGVSQSGIYKVDITAYDSTNPAVDIANLPVSSDTIELKFHTTPQVSIQAQPIACIGANPVMQTLITNASEMNPTTDVFSYQWFKNGNTITGANSLILIPMTTGTYYLEVSNGPCGISVSNSVEIKEKPQIIIAENATICGNESFLITSVVSNFSNLSSITYQWYQNDSPLLGETNPTLFVSSANQLENTNATYFLKSFEQNDCESNSNTVTIRINKQPEVNTISIPLLQCDYISPNNDGIAITNLNQAYNLITNSVANLSLNFYTDSALTELITTPESFVNTIPFSQTIYVKAFNGTCISMDTATIQLNINPTSIDSYPNMQPVCATVNQNYGYINFSQQETLIRNTIFAGNNVDITFFLNAIDASTELNALTNSTEIPIGLQTIYTRIETNNNCAGIGTFQVVVIAAPQRNIINQVKLCENESYVLNTIDEDALAGLSTTVQTSYFLSFENAQNNFYPINKDIALAYPLGISTIYIRLFDVTTQCYSITDFEIRVFNNPSIFNPNPISICGDTSAVFDLTIRNNYITGSNINYQVFYFETLFDLNSDIPILNPTTYSSSSKTIYVKVIDPTNNGCFKTTTLAISIVPIPGISTNPTSIELCEDNGFALFDLTQREAEMAGGIPLDVLQFKYYLSLNDALTNNANVIVNPSFFANSIRNHQKIYVRINSTTNFDGEQGQACYRILELDLFVRPYPKNNLRDYPYYICINQTGEVTENATVTTQLSETDYAFQWFEGLDGTAGNELAGETSSSFQTGNSGSYSVSVTNISNLALCSSIFNFNIINTLNPELVITNPTNLIGLGIENTIIATATPSSSDFEYSIFTDFWQESPIFTNIPAGDYMLQVRNKNGCGQISTFFSVIDYPLFFTPNGDGYNDTWNLKGTIFIEEASVFIFNKYGQLIKKLKVNDKGWDGSFNGKPLPSDDYWFKINYKVNGVFNEFKSHFSLKR